MVAAADIADIDRRAVMSPAPSKTQRWLDLIAFLVYRRFPVAIDEVMNGVPAYTEQWASDDETQRESARRKFIRDKNELAAAGIPIETVDVTVDGETTSGYRLSGTDFYLPYLRIVGDSNAPADPEGPAPGQGPRPMELEITAEEADTAIEALRRVAELPASPFGKEARSALNKLTFDLDPESIGESPVRYAEPEVRQVRESDASPEYIASESADDEPPFHIERLGTGGVRVILQLLTRAVRERKRATFRYHGIRRGEPTDRDVEPYGLLYQHGQWYLVGHDRGRDDMRVFRLGRIEGLSVATGASPDFDVPADFSTADYARRRPWELGDDEPEEADVRFEFPLSLWADRNRHGELVEEAAGGAAVRRFRVRQAGPFLRWLQQFAGDAAVVHPPALRSAQVELARQTAALYEK